MDSGVQLRSGGEVRAEVGQGHTQLPEHSSIKSGCRGFCRGASRGTWFLPKPSPHAEERPDAHRWPRHSCWACAGGMGQDTQVLVAAGVTPAPPGNAALLFTSGSPTLPDFPSILQPLPLPCTCTAQTRPSINEPLHTDELAASPSCHSHT